MVVSHARYSLLYEYGLHRHSAPSQHKLNNNFPPAGLLGEMAQDNHGGVSRATWCAQTSCTCITPVQQHFFPPAGLVGEVAQDAHGAVSRTRLPENGVHGHPAPCQHQSNNIFSSSRDFLNMVCTDILHLHNTNPTLFPACRTTW